MAGWVKLHRILAHSAIAAKPDCLSVWIHLLIGASHKHTSVVIGRQVVELEPGQMVFGRKVFSAKTGVSEWVIRSTLNVLETLHQITIKKHTKYSIISIVNWSTYQEASPANHQETTSKPPANHHIQEVQDIQEEIKSTSDPQSGSPEHVAVDQFDVAWKLYPKREGANPKNRAHSAWKARIKEGVLGQSMMDGLARYVTYCQAKGSIGTEYVMQTQRFFGKSREFENEWKVNAQKQSNHHGFDQRDYFDGLTKREDGTYGLS